MRDKNIKAVFDDLCGNLVLDINFSKRLDAYITSYLNRNPEHVAFFGGNLTGVFIIRYTDSDRRQFFEDLLGVEEETVRPRLHDLDTVNPEYQVSSDTFNLACLWLIYAIHRTSKLSTAQKEHTKRQVALLLNIKLLTSLLYRYFKYPADPEIAKATYEALTYKFLLKQCGSWNRLLEVRSNDIVDSKSIHYRTLISFDKDKDIIYTINDIQGRMREILKNVYEVFMRQHSLGSRIKTSSNLVEIDGVETLRDHTHSLQKYTRYLTSLLADKNSFIKEDLVQVIERSSKALPPRPFRNSLEWFSDHYGKKETAKIDKCINNTLVHAFEYLNANKVLYRNTIDLAELITRLRGTYLSSRNTDPLLQELKVDMADLIKLATNSKNDAMIAAVRTGVMLYIVARALSMRYYTSSVI